MILNDTEKCKKTYNKFVCDLCDYECCKKSDWIRHITRAKHVNNMDMIQNDTIKNAKNAKNANQYNCKCGNIYQHHSGLWRHKKTCESVATLSPSGDKLANDPELFQEQAEQAEPIQYQNLNQIHQIDPNILLDIIKQNQELQKQMIEFMRTNTQTTNNNCNNINNSFNLNLFLNEKCKDAININDFVNNITMKLSDLENFGQLGYVEGVSRILLKNLNDLDTYSRPIHCSDLKREVIYIKNNDTWTKETDDKPVLKNAIKQVANKNIKQIQNWKNENPGCTNSDSRKNDQYINIVMNSMSGGTNEEQQHNISQIVKNISKAVVIEKSIDS